MARVVCASHEIEPKDMAPLAKRLTMALDRLDLVERDWGDVLELQQVPQRDGRLSVVVDEPRVLTVELVVAGACGLLQLGDGVRVVQVPLAAQAPLVEAPQLQVGIVVDVVLDVGGPVAHEGLALDRGHVDTADARDGAREVLLHDLVGEPDGLEDLGADVRRHRGDAHLGHRLEEALVDGLEIVLAGFLERPSIGQEPAEAHVLDGLEGQVGVDGRGAVPEQGGEVVHLASLAGLHDEAGARAQALADEVVVDRGHGQQRRDGGVVRIDGAVGEDDDLVAVEDVLLGLAPEPLECALHAARLGREADGDGLGLEVLPVHPAQALQVLVGQHGVRQLDDARVLRPGGQHVALAAHEGDEAHDHLLADGVDGRVGDLREELVEVVEEAAATSRTARPAACRCPSSRAAPGRRGPWAP